MSEHGAVCPECNECCKDDHLACGGCGHCAEVHSFYGGYCDVPLVSELRCVCVLTPMQARKSDKPRWPEDDET